MPKIRTDDLLAGVVIHYVSIPIVGVLLTGASDPDKVIGLWIAWSFLGFGFMPLLWAFLITLFREM